MKRKIFTYFTIFVVLVLIAFSIIPGISIVKETERGVVFFMGKFYGVKEPGINYTPPLFSDIEYVDIRLVTWDIPKQNVITNDDISVNVDGVINYKVKDAYLAVTATRDFKFSIEENSQATLKKVCGEFKLDEILTEREEVNEEIRSLLKKKADSWGIEVSSVEVKNIEIPEDMQKVIAEEAIARRRKEAALLMGSAELEVAKSLVEAANIMGKNPDALKLRYFQLLQEVSRNESTILLPLPNDLFQKILN